MKRKSWLRLERLDERTLPATFGVPWSDPMHLTLSFAPDRTAIAGHGSNLFKTLDAQMPRAVWQGQVFRALQTWASAANISVGVVPDAGLPFGAPGLRQGDARVGDIRIGGQPMDPLALAISVPHDPFLSGTWSGDVLINSEYNYTTTQADLYSIMLHELGHVFGLEHSEDPNSVMFSHAAQMHSGLAPSDIAAIRALYGVRRPDINEGSNGNNVPDRATRIAFDDGEFPGIAFGDLTTLQDVDYYRIDTPDMYSGPMTVRVRSAGLSVLAPRMTLTDRNGNLIASGLAVDPAGNTVTVTVPSVTPDGRYYLRVERATSDAFAIGRFGVAVTFDDLLTVSQSSINAALLGPYDSLSPSELAKLFRPGQQYLNPDDGVNDTPFGAFVLEPSHGGDAITHFRTLASLETPQDVDYYRFTVDFNETQANVLTASVSGLIGSSVPARLELFSENLAPVPVTILANGNGTYTIQSSALAEQDYYLRVSRNTLGSASSNYSMTIDLGGRTASMQTFASGTLSPKRSSAQHTLYIGKTQLFQFLLTASGSGAAVGTPVNMTIANEFGVVVASLSGRVGETVSGPAVLLAPGPYTVRYSAKLSPGAGSVNFSLRGLNISDPIGPVRQDLTLDPRYVDPKNPNQFLYPNGLATLDAFIWTTIIYGT